MLSLPIEPGIELAAGPQTTGAGTEVEFDGQGFPFVLGRQLATAEVKTRDNKAEQKRPAPELIGLLALDLGIVATREVEPARNPQAPAPNLSQFADEIPNEAPSDSSKSLPEAGWNKLTDAGPIPTMVQEEAALTTPPGLQGNPQQLSFDFPAEGAPKLTVHSFATEARPPERASIASNGAAGAPSPRLLDQVTATPSTDQPTLIEPTQIVVKPGAGKGVTFFANRVAPPATPLESKASPVVNKTVAARETRAQIGDIEQRVLVEQLNPVASQRMEQLQLSDHIPIIPIAPDSSLADELALKQQVEIATTVITSREARVPIIDRADAPQNMRVAAEQTAEAFEEFKTITKADKVRVSSNETSSSSERSMAMPPNPAEHRDVVNDAPAVAVTPKDEVAKTVKIASTSFSKTSEYEEVSEMVESLNEEQAKTTQHANLPTPRTEPEASMRDFSQPRVTPVELAGTSDGRHRPNPIDPARPEPVRLPLPEPALLVRQLAHAIGAADPSDPRELVVRFDPPELGAVRLAVQRAVEGLSTTIQVERHDLRELLQRHIGDLRIALTDVGVQLGACTVELGAGDQSWTEERFSSQTRAISNGPRRRRTEEIEPLPGLKSRAAASLGLNLLA